MAMRCFCGLVQALSPKLLCVRLFNFGLGAGNSRCPVLGHNLASECEAEMGTACRLFSTHQALLDVPEIPMYKLETLHGRMEVNRCILE